MLKDNSVVCKILLTHAKAMLDTYPCITPSIFPQRSEGRAGLGEPWSRPEPTSLNTDLRAAFIHFKEQAMPQQLRFECQNTNQWRLHHFRAISEVPSRKHSCSQLRTPSIVLPETTVNPTFLLALVPKSSHGAPQVTGLTVGKVWGSSAEEAYEREDNMGKKITQMKTRQRKISKLKCKRAGNVPREVTKS